MRNSLRASIPDDLMRARIEALKSKREELQARVADLERHLQRLEVSQEQEAQAVAFAERVKHGLGHLDFAGRQQLLRLLVEDVTCKEGMAVVRTIIPLPHAQEKVQLHATPPEGV